MRAKRAGSCSTGKLTLHGPEITILNGKFVYLGAFESCGAWDKFDPEDEWNFVNNV